MNTTTQTMTPDQPTATATPRTDEALVEKLSCTDGGDEDCIVYPAEEIVDADFARTLERELAEAKRESTAQGEHAVAMTEHAQSLQKELAEAKAEVARLKVIDVPPQTIGDGTSSGPLSIFARGWNGYINTLREMHPNIQFREGCIDTSGRFHGDMTMADVNAYLRAVCAIHKSFCDEALTLCEDTGIAANIIAKMRDLRSAAIEEAMQARRA